ncbi:MAG: PilN domain-containing protein [Candidatus Omnitrophota bacterium]
MIEINLLPEELKIKAKSAKIIEKRPQPKHLLYLLPFLAIILIFSHIVLVFSAISKNHRLRLLNNKWQSSEPERKIVEDFNKQYSGLFQSVPQVNQLLQERITWSGKLNKLSQVVPQGIWFNQLSVSGKDFLLEGAAISLQKEEINLIKIFIDELKKDPQFFGDFLNLELNSVQRKNQGGYEIVEFVLSGALRSK